MNHENTVCTFAEDLAKSLSVKYAVGQTPSPSLDRQTFGSGLVIGFRVLILKNLGTRVGFRVFKKYKIQHLRRHKLRNMSIFLLKIV